MFERFPRKTLAATSAALLAALGVGGAAIAANNGTQPAKAPAAVQAGEKPGAESNAPENSATDPDNVQSTGPNDPNSGAKPNGTASKAAAAKSSTTETPGTEQSPSSESGGSAEAPGSETPGNDGPGGHADEPGNPNADHQFEGAE